MISGALLADDVADEPPASLPPVPEPGRVLVLVLMSRPPPEPTPPLPPLLPLLVTPVVDAVLPSVLDDPDRLPSVPGDEPVDDAPAVLPDEVLTPPLPLLLLSPLEALLPPPTLALPLPLPLLLPLPLFTPSSALQTPYAAWHPFDAAQKSTVTPQYLPATQDKRAPRQRR